MAKFDEATISRWRVLAVDWMSANVRGGKGPGDVTLGRDAWTIANHSGILNDAYTDRSVVDAHIQTALAVIFPNCVFRDAKRY